jgi:arsenite transporter
MDTTPHPDRSFLISGGKATLLFSAAIALGALFGTGVPETGSAIASWTDPMILTLVGLLFFEVRFEALARATTHWRFLALAWVANFVLIPLIGYVVASLFLSGKPLLFTGLFIYFMAPCTDWFLGFTRMARGNTGLGSVLLPLNLISQLLLFPVYLQLFTGNTVGAASGGWFPALWQWFLLPLAVAVTAHQVLRLLLPSAVFAKLLQLTGALVPWVLAALIFGIFSGNVTEIVQNPGAFALILFAVFIFFVSTWFLGEVLARRFRLAYPEHALLAMTTAARNAPLMLGLTMAALPDQPLIYAALIIGMLVEFPHLTALHHLLLRRNAAASSGHRPSSPTDLPAFDNNVPPLASS